MMIIVTARNIPVLVTEIEILVKKIMGMQCKVIWLFKTIKLEK